MNEIPEGLLYEGLCIDIAFGEPRPMFADLFRICGRTHPNFPPTGDFGFEKLDDLQFDQVDDYFGVRTLSGEGSDVAVWLFPLIGGEPVHHEPGPFDGVRLEYNVLRNPIRRAEYFLDCVKAFAALGAGCHDRARDRPLGLVPDLDLLRRDIDAVARHWAENGITVGSDAAMEIDL